MSIVCPNCDNENYVLGYVCHCGFHEEERTNPGFSVFEIPLEELHAIVV